MNYQRERDERNINLKDLLFSVLYRWRIMLAVGLALAILLGGWKGLSKWKDARDPAEIAHREAVYQAELENYQQDKARLEADIADLESSVSFQRAYLEESVLMAMDYHNVCEAQTTLYISTDYQILPEMTYQNTDQTQLILASYAGALTNGEILGDIAAKQGMEPKYLRELVTVTTQMNSILDIRVRHLDADRAEQIMDQLLDSLDALKGQFTRSLGSHEVSTVIRTVSTGVDMALATTQKNERTRLQEQEDKLETAWGTLWALEEPKSSGVSMKSVAKSAILFAVLGGAAGVLLAALAAVVCFVVSDRVWSGQALFSRLGLNHLGSIAPEKTAKGPDAWLRKLEGRVQADSPAADDLLAATVQNYANDAGALLVTGDGEESLTADIAARLRSRLPELRVVCCGSLLTDPAAVKALPECGGVVLVERCGQSRYSRVAMELRRILDAGKPVIGCVLQDR